MNVGHYTEAGELAACWSVWCLEVKRELTVRIWQKYAVILAHRPIPHFSHPERVRFSSPESEPLRWRVKDKIVPPKGFARSCCLALWTEGRVSIRLS